MTCYRRGTFKKGGDDTIRALCTRRARRRRHIPHKHGFHDRGFMKLRSDQISALLNRLTPIISVVLFAVAIAVVHHETKQYQWHEIRTAITGLSLDGLLAAGVMTAAGYLVLTMYDWLALKYAGEKLAYRRIALAAFLSYAISHNVGHALVSGGSMRYRLYSGWGVPNAAIAKVIVFCALTYIVGAVTLFVGAALVSPLNELTASALPRGSLTTMLIVGVLGLILWWGVITASHIKPLAWKGIHLQLPSLSLSIQQTLIAVIDLLAAGLVLYFLLADTNVPLGTFVIVYIVAQLLGLISQVPGGIGVFESTVLVLLGDQVPSTQVLAALIAYRVIYYFLPLIIAGLVLTLYEIRQALQRRRHGQDQPPSV
ncbi:MAG: lysylphosphatidylglycerol synthase domain-containing protein [Spongiibacteraceae bacterium]